jgi:hypothetical protein
MPPVSGLGKLDICMNKNLSSHQILLIGIASVLLLIMAFSFYLLKYPSAPFPFTIVRAPFTSTLLSTKQPDLKQPSSTPEPTRRTTYTPFATLLTAQAPSTFMPTSPITETITPLSSQMNTPTYTSVPGQYPAQIGTITVTQVTPGITPSPTNTVTITSGEYRVTGRVLQNGTPVVGATVEFKDDVAPRQSTTDQKGYYSFITMAPGTEYKLSFNQDDNPQLVPAAHVTSLAWIEGTLPTTANPIILPDLEISLKLEDVLFELQAPIDGATYSASAISSSNPIQFIWTLYNPGGSYHVELYSFFSDQPIWTSNQTGLTNSMWDGTLEAGSHITEGNYWWRVAVTRSAGNNVVLIFTQPLDILFSP